MSQEAIEVRGARVNNLKNISFSIPINLMTVVTGVSGSGKSSLAFDTIYAEGQRRYVESLSAYARQFLERIRVRLSRRRPKSTTICGCCSRASAPRFVACADGKFIATRRNPPRTKLSAR